jgi:hypothetical protein
MLRTAVILCFVLLLLPVGWPVGASADVPGQAGLVIQYGEGWVETRCVSFQGDEISGTELLTRSGLEVVMDPSSGLGVTICQIESQGCAFPADPCFCQCMGAGECAYWNYYYRDEGAMDWTYSALGAVLRRVRTGSVEAWVWGDGKTPPSDEMTFAAICSPPEPTSTATPMSPTTEPGTPTAPAEAPHPTQPPAEPSPPPSPTPILPATLTPPATPTSVSGSPSPDDTGGGLFGLWPFGLVAVSLIAIGAIVWFRRA